MNLHPATDQSYKPLSANRFGPDGSPVREEGIDDKKE